MKRLFIYIHIMAALLLTACSDGLDFEQSGKGRSASVRFAIPVWSDSGVGTRAGVSSEDIGISEGSMQLLCFDASGFFIGLADNTTTTPNDKYNGSVTAKVPLGTCRIHFIANANLSSKAEWLGMSENTLISQLTANDGDDMVYWGYKRCANESEMTSFLNSDETVLMLRDEAKVSVVVDDQTNVSSEDQIDEAYLTVCNDLDKGTLAPFDYSNLDNPFSYDEKSETSVTIARSAEKRAQPNSVGTDTEQFIFESQNMELDPIKVILKVTYKDGETKYHQIQLLDDKYEPHEILRNHNYEIHIKQLDKDLGKDTFDGAVNGEPSNNPNTIVDDIIPEVSQSNYTLRIIESTDGTTYRLYNEAGTKTIEFEYGGDDAMTAEDFTVKWQQNDGISTPTRDLKITSYDTSKHHGTITFPINTISSNIQEGIINLQDTKHGLARNVHVYAVNKFDFNGKVEKNTKETKIDVSLDSESAVVCEANYIPNWFFGGYYQYTSPQSIAFTFTGDDNITASDFSVAWKSGVTNSASGGNPSISSYSNGKGEISVPITGPTNDANKVYSGTLALTVNGNGYTLTREIKIYTALPNVKINENLTREDPSTKNVDIMTTTYALTFNIPKSYPTELMPINVEIATNELQPINEMNQLGVVVESTSDIGQTWNYWYTHSVNPSENDTWTYTLYFEPIRSDTDKGNIYLKADHFNTCTVKIP